MRKYMVAAVCGLLMAVSLIAISEISYHRSADALAQLLEIREVQQRTGELGSTLKTTESAQRGYLLTGEAFYLSEYKTEADEVRDALAHLKQALAALPDMRFGMAALESGIASKMSEMDMAVNLREQGHVDASQFVTSTDVGRTQMAGIATLLQQLHDNAAALSNQNFQQVQQTQEYSRIGLTLAAITALLAFLLYLRRSLELDTSITQANAALEQERAHLEQLVRERTRNLRELATHLQQVREVDRAKLARELHDELGALLTSAKLSLARLKPRLPADDTQAQPLMASLADTLGQVIALKRRIIEDLRPSSLDNFGLMTALDILTREFQERAGLSVETSIEPVEVTPDAQLSLYRLVQESLTNVAKYAQATQVFVGLRVYRTHVELTVRDNGVGFDQAVVKPRSHGLAGMRHRVESLGGRLDVRSRPGHGTTIFAAFPTGPAAPDAAPAQADTAAAGLPPEVAANQATDKPMDSPDKPGRADEGTGGAARG